MGKIVVKLGDVNSSLEGLQEKYGEERVFDVGIREVTIIGQATGMAMRGMLPIAEIQYLDYLVYALQHMTDDIASLLLQNRRKPNCANNNQDSGAPS